MRVVTFMDREQFQWDDGSWYLHLGDTGYQYISPDEDRNWKVYLDQSVTVCVGMTRDANKHG